MGAQDFGNQLIIFDYKQPADSDLFNKLFKDVETVGVYSGYKINKISNTYINVDPGTLVISDSSGYTARIETTVQTIQIACSNVLIYVVARWSYVASTSNYMDILCTATPLSTDIVLGKLVYSGSVLNSIDYSYRTYANSKDQNILIDSISNNLYLQPDTNFWFISNDGYTIKHITNSQKTLISALSSNSNYYLYYNGTAYAVTTTPPTGLAYSTILNGWYDTAGNRILALVNSNGSNLITLINYYNSETGIGVTGPGTSVSGNIATFNGTTGDIISDSGKTFSIDGSMAANSDDLVPTQKAVVTQVKNKAIAYALVFG